MFEKLGVTEITAADVADAAFSDPALVKVETIKDVTEQITDWRLRSLAPFRTDEALTLTLKNGRSVEIKVTDAVTSESGNWTNGSNGSGTWSIDEDGTLTISGSGAMTEYSGVNNTEWYKYINKNSESELFVKKLVFENGITTIGKNSFTRAYYVEKLNAQNCTSLTTIGESAFKQSFLTGGSPNNKSNPKKVDFSGCTSLNKINGNAFQFCEGIEYLDISGTQLSQSHLTNTSAGFGASKAAIQTLKARNCSNISGKLDLSSFTKLSEIDLSNCSNITSVVLPDSVTTLNLEDCTQITSLDLSGKNKLKNLTLPSSITTLNLTGCTGLESFDLPASVTSLNLTNCTGLQNFTIPKTLTSLDLTGCQGVTFRFNGERREWENLKSQHGYVVPEDVVVVCNPLVSSDLAYFVSEVTYSEGSETETHQITEPVIVRPDDEFTMNIHFEEKPDTDPDCRKFDFSAQGTENPVLTYSLPDYVSVDETFTQGVTCYGFSGNIRISGNQLKLVWDYNGHIQEDIEKFQNAIKDFSIRVPVKIGLPDTEASIPFGKDYRGDAAFILKADQPHNPLVLSKTAGEYDPAENTVTFSVTVKAEGNVDNNGKEYPVVIQARGLSPCPAEA